MLRELLLDKHYACRWQAYIGRRQTHALHQSGICQVIAEYLRTNHLHPLGDEALPRKLKDRVYRALGGQSLSLGTLRWFIEAFEMSPDDTATLLRLAGSHAPGGTVIGRSLVKPGVLPPRRHRTVSLQEWHRVGPDGLPESHRSLHLIRANERLDRYPYIFDTDAASVRVVHGGRASEPYALDNGLYAVDIMLDQTLDVGETASMEYETTFWYRTPPPQEFRRASSGRIDNLDLRSNSPSGCRRRSGGANGRPWTALRYLRTGGRTLRRACTGIWTRSSALSSAFAGNMPSAEMFVDPDGSVGQHAREQHQGRDCGGQRQRDD